MCLYYIQIVTPLIIAWEEAIDSLCRLSIEVLFSESYALTAYNISWIYWIKMWFYFRQPRSQANDWPWGHTEHDGGVT